MTIIPNAILVSYTTPATPDARGGNAPGSTTSYPDGTQAAVGQPTRSQLISNANQIADCTAVIYMPAAGPSGEAFAVATGGKIAYRLNGAPADEAGQILKWTPWVRGGETSFEVFVKAV